MAAHYKYIIQTFDTRLRRWGIRERLSVDGHTTLTLSEYVDDLIKRQQINKRHVRIIID